jgi:SET domain-containing protein
VAEWQSGKVAKKKEGKKQGMSTTQRIAVEQSSIHGKGLFARTRIRRNAHIADFEGDHTQRDGTHVLWVDEGDGWIGIRGRNELRFLNHSPNPNAEFRGRALHATRNIQPGDEITFHYGDEWEEIG